MPDSERVAGSLCRREHGLGEGGLHRAARRTVELLAGREAVALLQHLLGHLEQRVAHARAAEARQPEAALRVSRAGRPSACRIGTRPLAASPLSAAKRLRRDLVDGARLLVEAPGQAVGRRRDDEEAEDEAQLPVGDVVPIEVREHHRRQIERHQGQEAEDREEQEQVAVHHHHRQPVELSELVDQQPGGRDERRAQDDERNGNEYASPNHGRSPFQTSPQAARLWRADAAAIAQD